MLLLGLSQPRLPLHMVVTITSSTVRCTLAFALKALEACLYGLSAGCDISLCTEEDMRDACNWTFSIRVWHGSVFGLLRGLSLL